MRVSDRQPFGSQRDGESVERLRLSSPHGLDVCVITYGARVQSLRVPTAAGPREVVLGYPSVDGYEADTAYLGAVVGRCCNRIADSRFHLDGRVYRLSANEGRHHLHGGRGGLHRRLWTVRALESAPRPRLVLGCRSPDGDDGYPGTLDVEATFEVEGLALVITLEARTDQATPVNLTTHHYFNLEGGPPASVLEHRLAVAADAFLPVDADLIPTGERRPVDGTPFDLRRPAVLADRLAQTDPQLDLGRGIDHCFVLSNETAAVLSAPGSDLRMTLTTNQPGLQVYTGNRLGDAGLWPRHAGLCLEPQQFPNAINEPSFPPPLLRPGEIYRNASRYAFEVSARE